MEFGCFQQFFSCIAEKRLSNAKEYLEDTLASRPNLSHVETCFIDEIRKHLDKLMGQSAPTLYAEASPFQYFIDGGSNVPLYENIAKILADLYQSYGIHRLLDVGAGSGQAVAPALRSFKDRAATHITLVEPAADMLAMCTERVGTEPSVQTFNMTIEQFMQHSEGSDARWELGQASWSLQNVTTREERIRVFRWLRERCDRFAVAEFDVPAYVCEGSVLTPERVHYICERFARGLQEYAPIDSVEYQSVAQGFLMPVLFGKFPKEGTPPQTYEQPMDAWADELREAGFTQVDRHVIYPYWWADGVLLVAS